MGNGLVKAAEYGCLTFINTSNAFKAEKVLKETGTEFVMMPTPREISTSCGLAVKVFPEAVDAVRQILEQNRVSVEGIYQICREQDGKNTIHKLAV
ncbi:MAG: DUF3343 domain-containing protein [Bacillota bacterium]|nr:DUF3343 domain-containing protein [Bacillota bacterium]